MLLSLSFVALAALAPPAAADAAWLPSASSARDAAATALDALCPGGWEHAGPNVVACQQAYGDYGFGAIRPCREGGTYGAAAFVLHAQGLCDRRSGANLTLDAAEVADDVAGRVGEARAGDAVDAALAIFCPGGGQGPGAYQVACQQAYGDYGFGAIRPCREGGATGAAAPELQAAGACGPRAPANLARALAGEADALVDALPLP